MPVEILTLSNKKIFDKISEEVQKISKRYGVNLYPSAIKVGKDVNTSNIDIFIEAVEYDGVPYPCGRKYLSIKTNSGKLKRFAAKKDGSFDWRGIALTSTDEAEAKRIKDKERAKVLNSPGYKKTKKEYEEIVKCYGEKVEDIFMASIEGFYVYIDKLSKSDVTAIIRLLNTSTTYKFGK